MAPFVALDTTSHEQLLPEADERWRPAHAVPFRLAVTIPLLGLKLRSLRALCAGAVFATGTPAGDDVPVTVAGATLGWCELHSQDGHMALRLTRLA